MPRSVRLSLALAFGALVALATWVVQRSGKTGEYLVNYSGLPADLDIRPFAIGALAAMAGWQVLGKPVLDEVKHETSSWELGVQSSLGSLYATLYGQSKRAGQDGKICSLLDIEKTALSVYLIRRPIKLMFRKRLRLATRLAFYPPRPANIDWRCGKGVMGMAWELKAPYYWARSEQWQGLSNSSFTERDWEEKASEKLNLSYDEARKLQDYDAIIAAPIVKKIKSNSRPTGEHRTRVIGVLELSVNEGAYRGLIQDCRWEIERIASAIANAEKQGS